jgi:peptidoglycan/xylan/chitin deacetylase (PgdA/CDA1 family)
MKILKSIIKELLALMLRCFGFNFMMKTLISKHKATILVFHKPPKEIFSKHIEYINKHYNIIKLKTLVDAIYTKDWSQIPSNAIVITLDDGYIENYLLLDIIKKFDIYPTIYLSSGVVNTNREFWFSTKFKNIKKLKRFPNSQRLNFLKENLGFSLVQEQKNRQTLNLKEIKEMGSHVDFQSHSKFHPILITCDDKESRREIYESKKDLEELLEKKVNHFSFPNGAYSEREIIYLKKSGYKSARTNDVGWNDVNTDPFRLKAMVIHKNDHSINKLSTQISGIFPYLRCLRKGRIDGSHPPFN